VKGIASGIGSLASGLMPKLGGFKMSIERTAELGERMPGAIHGAVEALSSMALLPNVVKGTPDQLLASMGRAGLERTVVIAVPHVSPNAWVLEQATEAKGRFVPVCTLPDVDAKATGTQWTDACEALARAGAKGFKIHPNMDGHLAAHPGYRAMFEVAQAHGLFIILHTGCFNVIGYRKHGAPDLESYSSLFAEFPTVRVCLAHMNREAPERAWAIMKKFEQLFADTSWQPANNVRAAINAVGASRVLLGSDWPLLHADLQADALEVLRKVTNAAERDAITVQAAKRFLGEA
jgi:uncharacterized protein